MTAAELTEGVLADHGFMEREPKVAIVHDWFEPYAGAERVVEQMLEVLPQADIYAVVDFLSERDRVFLGGRPVHTSFIQRLPGSRRFFRSLLLLLPLAIESFDLSGYDVVVSSSHAIAKGILTGPDQLHLCMCYSPIRYAWDLQHQYLEESGLTHGLKGLAARLVLHYMRIWDSRTTNGVDQFISISRYISRRIRKTYGRDSTVIYPPVDVEAFGPQERKDDFYLAASRLVPYKKINLIVEAFAAMPDRQLIVIGDGPMMPAIKAHATPNIRILGYQPFQVLKDHMQRARGFVFAAEEDFGIAVVEAQACGTPVICYGRGGATETVIPGKTGIFFHEQSAAAICQAVTQFEEHTEFDPLEIRSNAERFGRNMFRTAFRSFFEQQYLQHRCRLGKQTTERTTSL
jgi:glycosyltransferase involved in cell wall biosynthesis